MRADASPTPPARPSWPWWAHGTAIAASALAFGLCAHAGAIAVPLLAVALLPWLAALDRCTRARTALLSGLVMSLCFAAAVFAWFAAGIASYGGLPLAYGWLMLLLAAPLLQPQLFAYALVRQQARARLGDRRWVAVAWLATSAWIAADAFWPKLFADGLGHGLHASRHLRQAADLAGVHGLTLAILWENELLFRAWQVWRARPGDGSRRPGLRAPLLGALAIPALLALYGFARLAELDRAPKDEALRVAIVQADISQYERLAARSSTYDVTRRILDEHFALSQQALGGDAPDWILWPETVYPTSYGAPRSQEGAEMDLEIGAFVASRGVPLLFGAYDVAQPGEPSGEYNAGFFLMPVPAEGERGGGGAAPSSSSHAPELEYDVYRKRNLFPFTERLPEWIDHALVRRLLPWAGAWRAGSGPARVDLDLMDGRTIPIAPLICYDALDPALVEESVRAGARLIATLSNDSWFAEGGGPMLHLVVASYRSIESRLPQVRSTNTGISALIDATGEIVDHTDVHERTVLAGAVQPRPGRVGPFGHGGRWLAWALVGSSLVGIAGSVARSRATAQARPASRRDR